MNCRLKSVFLFKCNILKSNKCPRKHNNHKFYLDILGLDSFFIPIQFSDHFCLKVQDLNRPVIFGILERLNQAAIYDFLHECRINQCRTRGDYKS